MVGKRRQTQIGQLKWAKYNNMEEKEEKEEKVKDEGEEERREEKGGRVARRSLLPWDKESGIASIIIIFLFVDYNVM